MDGKSRKLESAKGVVNTPVVVAGPRAPMRSNLDDPEEWEIPCSDGESVCWDEARRMELVACRPIIKCGTTGCTWSCPTSVVGHGYTAGQTRAVFVGGPIGFLGMFSLVSSRHLLAMLRKKSYWMLYRGLGSQRAGSFLLWLWQRK